MCKLDRYVAVQGREKGGTDGRTEGERCKVTGRQADRTDKTDRQTRQTRQPDGANEDMCVRARAHARTHAPRGDEVARRLLTWRRRLSVCVYANV